MHAVVIAGAVGSLLTIINLGLPALVRPWQFPADGSRIALDFLTPFLVASLGAVLANRKTRAVLRAWDVNPPVDRP